MSEVTENHTDEEKRYRLAWGLFCELRKEIGDDARVIYQITSLKITFISGSIAVILANVDKDFPKWIIIIPSMATLFFDHLVVGRTIRGFRVGRYLRRNVEPILKQSSSWPSDKPLWGEYLAAEKQWQPLKYATIGNLGMTFLFCTISMSTVIFYESLFVAVLTAVVLFSILACSALIYEMPQSYLGYETYSKKFIELLKGNAGKTS